MKKQMGIWLDFKEAYLISWEGEQANTRHILSEIENFRPKGGARSATPYGPMDKVSESKYLARRKQQESQYFRKLLGLAAEADELFVFGPAEAKNHFAKLIREAPDYGPKLLDVVNADSMTYNQMTAMVRKFFSQAV